MPAMVSRTCLPLGRRTFSLPRRDTVCHQQCDHQDLQSTDKLTVTSDLVTYCEREGVPFTIFEDWKSILATTQDIA